MVVNKKFVLSFLILLLINFAVAQGPLILSEVKDSYSGGEYFLVNGSINNIFEYPVLVNVESLLSNEKGTLPLAIIPFEFRLDIWEEKNIEIYNFLINDNMVSDRYTFEIRVLFNGQEVTKRSFDFDIVSIKEFSFNLDLDKKIFLKGENIFLDHSSEISDVDSLLISTTLIYPNGKTESITLPTSIKAEQIGTYTLEVTASKEGYKTITKKEQFAVIENEVEIEFLDVSQIPSGNYPRSSSNGIYLLVGLAVLIIVALFVVLFVLFRKRRNQVVNELNS